MCFACTYLPTVAKESSLGMAKIETDSLVVVSVKREGGWDVVYNWFRGYLVSR